MKNLFCFLSVFLFFAFPSQINAQDDDNWDIKLGKRKNLIFRKIKEINLGNTFTSFNPLFFKVGPEGEWQKVGVTGQQILPYIPSTEFSAYHFKKYKTKKIKSYWSLGFSIVTNIGWGISSIDYLSRGMSVGKALLKPRSMAFLVGGLGLNLLGAHWNTKGDLNLFMAVNGEQVEKQKPRLSWYLNGTSDGQLLLGLRF